MEESCSKTVDFRPSFRDWVGINIPCEMEVREYRYCYDMTACSYDVTILSLQVVSSIRWNFWFVKSTHNGASSKLASISETTRTSLCSSRTKLGVRPYLTRTCI